MKHRSPSPFSISRHRSTDEKKVSPLPSEDDLLPRTREFNATSPISRYSDAAWLKRVKDEKRTDRVLGEEKSIWLDNDEDDEDDKYGVKKEFKRSASSETVTNEGATDVFDHASPNEWSKYEHLVDDDLSPPRSYEDGGDSDDPLRALDADDDWRSGTKKRSRNNAGLPVSLSSKDLEKSKQALMTPTKAMTKSDAGALLSSSALVAPRVDHFDLSELDEYRNEPIVLDDEDLTGDYSVEKEIERRRKLRQQQGKKATLMRTDSPDLEDMDDLSTAAKPRQRNGKTKAIDSDLEFDANNSDGEDGSDTGSSKPLTAKERKKEEARLKREAVKKKKDEEKAAKDMKKALERSAKEAEAAERRAKGQTRDSEAQRKKREREEERRIKMAETEAAKQAERELNAANRLVPKSKSVEEMVLCMEESMFDSELGKALQTYLQAIECRIDLLKSPVSTAIAVAAAAAANASRPIGDSSSSSLSDLNGTNDACPVRDLIFWRRIVKKRYDEQKAADVNLPEEEHTVELESYWLCHMTAKEFCKKIKDNELHRFLDSVSRDMRTRIKRQKAKQEAMGLIPTTYEDRSRRQRVIVMIMGLSAHLRGLKTMTSRDFAERVRAKMQAEYGGGGGAGKAAKAIPVRDNAEPDEDRIDKELLRLQLDEDCLIILTDDYDESAQLIVSLTEQLGQRPYKYLPMSFSFRKSSLIAGAMLIPDSSLFLSRC